MRRSYPNTCHCEHCAAARRKKEAIPHPRKKLPGPLVPIEPPADVERNLLGKAKDDVITPIAKRSPKRTAIKQWPKDW